MKVTANDLGICGVQQLMYAGTVSFDTDGVTNGIVPTKLPHAAIVTRAVVKVTTGFSGDAKITVGTDEAMSNILSNTDSTAGTAGTYTAQKFVEVKKGAEIKAKITTAATAGAAEIYLFVVGIPED